MEKQNYITPEVEIIEVEIEKGFAASNDEPLENPLNGGNFDW